MIGGTAAERPAHVAHAAAMSRSRIAAKRSLRIHFLEKVLDLILDDKPREVATHALILRETRWFARRARVSNRSILVSVRSQIVDENARQSAEKPGGRKVEPEVSRWTRMSMRWWWKATTGARSIAS